MKKQKWLAIGMHAVLVSSLTLWYKKQNKNKKIQNYSFTTQGLLDWQNQILPHPWKPKDRKDQGFPASRCSQTANDSTKNQAVIEKRRKVIGWLKGNGDYIDLRRSCSLRTGTILDPNWKVKRTFGFELLIAQIMHGSHFVKTLLVSLVQDEHTEGWQ